METVARESRGAKTHRSSLFGSAPSLKTLQRAALLSSANGDDKDGGKHAVMALYFWYHFRRLFPLFSTLSIILAFLIPLCDPNKTIDSFLLAGGVMSSVTLIFLFVSYSHIPPWRRHPSSLILQRAVSSFVFSIVMMGYPIYNLSKGIKTSSDSVFDGVGKEGENYTHKFSDFCRMISFVTQSVLFSGELWIFILSLDLYISLTNPFASYKNNLKKYQTTAFISTAVISTVLVAQDSCQGSIFREGVCWIRVDSVLSPCIWGYFFIWCCLFYSSSIGVVLFAFTRLRSGLEVTYETRKACVSDSSSVVFSYIFYGAIIAVLIVINSFQSSNDNYTAYLLAYMISMRGFVDGLVWFYLHDFSKDETSYLWVDRFTRGIYGPFEWLWSNLTYCCKISDSDDKNKKGFGERDVAQTHLTYSNTLESPLWNQRASLTSDGDMADRKSLRDETASHRDTILGTGDADALDIDLSPQLNMALRAELLHYVSFGIHESVKRAEDREVEHKRQVQLQAELLSQRFTQRARNESADAWGSSSPSKTHDSKERDAVKESPNGNANAPVYHLQNSNSLQRNASWMGQSHSESFRNRHGIQSYKSSTSSIRSSLSAAFRFASEAIGIHRETIGSDNVQPLEDSFTMEEKYLFTDYCPGQFRELRSLCGIAEDWYLEQISQPTKEIIQEGASGAFMFYCGQGDLLVKTVERDESLALQNILMQYAEHIRNNPDSLLVRFLGLHSLKIYSTEFIFVVMKNIFPPDQIINERFDIKGSWVARNAKPYPPGKQTPCRYCSEMFTVGSQAKCPEIVGPHEANIIFKDNDLISKIRLQPEDAYHVIDSLNKDSDALYNMGITDYSLLIGVKNQQYDVNINSNATSGSTAFRLSVSHKPSMSSMSHHPSVSLKPNANPSDNIFNNNNNNNNVINNNTVNDKTARFYDEGYGARAVVAPVAYYFGVIDILQTWSLKKKLERMVKTYILRYPEEGLSCMAPRGYMQRFQRKISQIIEHSIFVREITGSWLPGKRDVSEPTAILKPMDDQSFARESMVVGSRERDSIVNPYFNQSHLQLNSVNLMSSINTSNV